MPKSKVREVPTVERQLRSVNISLLQQTASVGPKRESQEEMRVQISIYIYMGSLQTLQGSFPD